MPSQSNLTVKLLGEQVPQSRSDLPVRAISEVGSERAERGNDAGLVKPAPLRLPPNGAGPSTALWYAPPSRDFMIPGIRR
jgi:hypothetical protein